MRSLTAGGTPHPFSTTTPSGRVVTWPDPMVWELPAAAAWLQHLQHSPLRSVLDVLPDELDRAALADLSVDEARSLARDVLEHYTRVWASPEELSRVAWLLDRHPGPVLWDLTARGVDVRGWVRDRRWWDLAVLLEELPQHSATHEALVNDPQWVDRQVQVESDAGGVDTSSSAHWRPRVRDWDLVAQQLADLAARVDAVFVATRQVSHAVVHQQARSAPAFSPPKTRPFPGPRTLLDVRRDEVVAAETWALYGMFQPGLDLTPETPEGAANHGEDQDQEDDDREGF